MPDGRWLRIVRWLVLGALTVFTALPMVAMLVTSVRPAGDVRDSFQWIPARLTLNGYHDMWTAIPFGRYLSNSLMVAVTSAIVTLLVAVPAGYALTRWEFRGRGPIAAAIVAGQMVPGTLFLVPLFGIFVSVRDRLGVQLIGTRASLIVTAVALCLPLAVWLLSRYFSQVPIDVQQAAQLDGAGPLSVLTRIAMPMARPGIVAVGVLAFTLTWGEVLFATVLSDADSRTLAVGLADYTAGPVPQWNVLMAAAITAALPAVSAFGYLQRTWFRSGSRAAGRNGAGNPIAGSPT